VQTPLHPQLPPYHPRSLAFFLPRSAWSIGKKGELAEVACRKRAHGERVAGIALRGALLYSVSYDGALKAWDADNLDIVVDRCVRSCVCCGWGCWLVACLPSGPC
jgi:hypothetical protein